MYEILILKSRIMNVTPKFQLFFTIFILALCSQSSHAAEQIAQDYVEQYPILAEGFTLIRTVSSPSFVQKFGVDGYPDFQEFMEEVSSTPLVVLESRAHWCRGCTVRRRSFVHDFDILKLLIVEVIKHQPTWF